MKTVYFLGAGFSHDGGAPFQKDIITWIFNLNDEEIPDNSELKNLWDLFDSSRKDLKEFLKELFNCNDNLVLSLELEDIFTILDKAILSDEFIGKYSVECLIENRRKLNFCLVYMFDVKLLREKTNFYRDLAHNIVNYRLKENKDDDTFSFINLNWDLLLDNAINDASNSLNTDCDKTALDYCFYTDPLTNNDRIIPSIRLKSEGFKNIKMLKPHGSFNWLLCKSCGKIFITFDKKIAILEYMENKNECPKCKNKALKSVILTPTLLKDFKNVHLGDILHNIHVELLEADEIFFIGYSLPLADLELRYIMKKSIRASSHIKLILKESSDFNSIKLRFKTFFGNQFKESKFEKEGSQTFFKNKFGL